MFNCSIDNKEANKIAVEKLRAQLITGKFDKLYNDNIKGYMSKQEFVENIKFAVSMMKEFDENLNWQQDEAMDDRRVQEVYSYSDASWRTMEKNGRKLNITIWWLNHFSFCDLTISEDFSDKPEIVVSRCSKS